MRNEGQSGGDPGAESIGRWNRSPRRDSSLVYRDSHTGCTLQNVSHQSGNGVSRPSRQWLLFTADLLLVASLKTAGDPVEPPIEAAEQELSRLFESGADEPPISSIDYAASYPLP